MPLKSITHLTLAFTLLKHTYIEPTNFSQLTRALISPKSLSKDTLLLLVSLHKLLHSVFSYIFLFSVLLFSSSPFSSLNLLSSPKPF